LPRLTDTANTSYGTDPANSICGDQTVSVAYSNGKPIEFLEMSTSDAGVSSYTVETTDIEEYG